MGLTPSIGYQKAEPPPDGLGLSGFCFWFARVGISLDDRAEADLDSPSSEDVTQSVAETYGGWVILVFLLVRSKLDLSVRQLLYPRGSPCPPPTGPPIRVAGSGGANQ